MCKQKVELFSLYFSLGQLNEGKACNRNGQNEELMVNSGEKTFGGM